MLGSLVSSDRLTPRPPSGWTQGMRPCPCGWGAQGLTGSRRGGQGRVRKQVVSVVRENAVGGAHGTWVVHTACGGRTEEVMEGPGKAPEGVLPGEESGENFRQKANCGVRGSSQDIGGGDEVGALSRHREYSIADAKGHRECTLGKPLPQANFPASLNLCTHCLIVGQLD